MEHLNSEKLRKYAARQLSDGEMTMAILHFDSCAGCFDLLQNLPSQTAAENFLSLTDEKKDGEFHLGYDEFLRPFVDNEADEITREIVESHAQVCSNCAFQLRELREFSQSLRLREIEKNLKYSPTIFDKFGHWASRISRNLTLRTAFVLFLMLILGFAAFILFDKKPPVSTQNNRESNAVESTVVKQNNENQADLPKNNERISTENNQNIERRKPLIVKNDGQNNKNTNSETRITGNFDELQNLPAVWREKIRSAMRSEKLAFPAFLTSLRTNGKVRGEAENKQNELFPNGEVVRRVAPSLSWKSFAKPNEKYIVKIFDETYNQIAVSEPLQTNTWNLPVNLERGKIYHWEVAAPSGNYQANFKVLDQVSLNEINLIENKTSASPIIRGIAYSSAGLLSEAKKAFIAAAGQKKSSKSAQVFLRQIK